MDSTIFTCCMPALMTPCKEDRTPDFDALVKQGKEMIEAGMGAVVYCGSMGDWPLLTDAERMKGVEALVDAGLPVVAGAWCHEHKNGRRTCSSCAESRCQRLDDYSTPALPHLCCVGSESPFRSRALSCPRPARRHLQQPLLWLCNPRRPFLRAAQNPPEPRWLQGIWRAWLPSPMQQKI